jgi:hypothetical protein
MINLIDPHQSNIDGQIKFTVFRNEPKYIREVISNTKQDNLSSWNTMISFLL